MRKILTLTSVLLLAVGSTQAIDFISTNTFTVAEDGIVESESWIYSQTGRVEGVVRSDIFILADQLDLSGAFSNDVWGVATSASFGGEAGDQLRLAGQKVLVSGSARDGLIAIGETVKCDADSLCDGGVYLIGGDVIFEGVCGGDATIIANRATLNGRFEGDVRLIANDIVVTAASRIDGDLVYTAPKELYLPNRNVLGGELIRKTRDRAEIDTQKLILSTILTQSLWFLGALIVGIPLVSVFSVFTIVSVDELRRSTWRCLFTGFAALFLIPIFSFLIIGSIIGIPLAAILMAFYGILIYLAKYPVAMLLGIFILRNRRPTSFKGVFLLLVVGLGAIYILTALPYIGGTIRFVVTVYGLGALVTSIISKRQRVIRVDASGMPPPAPTDHENKSNFNVADDEHKG